MLDHSPKFQDNEDRAGKLHFVLKKSLQGEFVVSPLMNNIAVAPLIELSDTVDFLIYNWRKATTNYYSFLTS